MRTAPVAVLLLSLSAYLFLQRPYLSSSALSFVAPTSGSANLAVITTEPGKIALLSSDLPDIPYGKVLIRVHYAPINPSDSYRALGNYQIEGIDSSEYPHRNGFEGSGVVVGSGGGFLASLYAYSGAHVAFVVPSCGSWGRFVVADPMEMFPLIFAGVSDLDGAASFVNPMTVVGMLEVAKEGRHRSLVHTAATSSLGIMLLRAAPIYNVTIVAVVRGEKNADILRIKINHPSHLIVRSDLPDYTVRLREAIKVSGATLAFDAVGGQSSVTLYEAMPSQSITYVYGRLGGEKEPDSLYEKSTPQKTFAFFHLKHWMDDGGLSRRLVAMDAVTRLLGKELATEYERVLDLDDRIIAEIEKYFAHQKGGKIAIRMWPNLP